MMIKFEGSKLSCHGRLLSGLASVCVAIGPILISAIPAQPVSAQTAPANSKDIADTWQGTLHAGKDLRTVVKIAKADGDGYTALLQHRPGRATFESRLHHAGWRN